MHQEPEREPTGVSAGNGMIMGAAVGAVFTPALGALALVFGAGIGLLAGAAIAR